MSYKLVMFHLVALVLHCHNIMGFGKKTNTNNKVIPNNAMSSVPTCYTVHLQVNPLNHKHVV